MRLLLRFYGEKNSISLVGLEKKIYLNIILKNNFKNYIMTKRGINLYELVFGAFFVLKLAKLTPIADWNWFFIFLPLIIGKLHRFIIWVYEGTKLRQELADLLSETYVDIRAKQIAKKYLKEARKQT